MSDIKNCVLLHIQVLPYISTLSGPRPVPFRLTAIPLPTLANGKGGGMRIGGEGGETGVREVGFVDR